MQTDEMKSTWKSGLSADIEAQYHPEGKLNEFIVRSAKRSMRSVYPGIVWRIVIIGCIAGFAVMLFWGNQSPGIIAVFSTALIILSVSYFLWEYSQYKMNRYTCNMPVKEWLEYRIREIEKSVRIKTKYGMLLYLCALLAGTGTYLSYVVQAGIPLSLFTVIVIPLGIAVYLWFSTRSLGRNYKNMLADLKELYRLAEE